MRKKRVVCVGSNIESEVALKGLVDKQADIVGLITRPSGNGKGICDYVDLHRFCKDSNITVIDTLDINSSETLEALKILEPDFIFTLGWSQLFKEELLSIPKQYVVGSHPSPLPEGRGRAPIPWTILQKQEKTAVTLFRMDSGIDSGNIVKQRFFHVPSDAYAMELYMLVAENLRDAYCELYRDIQQDTVTEREQDLTIATHRGKRVPADGHIDFHQQSVDIIRLIRSVSHPYPGAYTYFKGRKVQIWKADFLDIPNHTGTIGQVLDRQGDKLLVQAHDAPLWVEDFTIDGQPVKADNFLIGKKFGYAVEDELHYLLREVRRLKEIVGHV